MNLPLPNYIGRLLLVLLVNAVVLFGLTPAAQASHIRAGDIQAKSDTTANPNPRRVFFKMVLYQATNLVSNVDEKDVTIFFGDGTCTLQNGVPRFSKTQISPTVFRNIYYFEHTYNAPGQYTVSYIGENRNAQILNMTDPGNRTFYISTTITIDPALGVNRSPVLTAPAIDNASANQVFLHNPGAFDADGDSLSYELMPSQAANAVVVAVTDCTPRNAVVPGFVYPSAQSASPGGKQVSYSGTPPGVVGADAIFTVDSRTGQIVWNSPVRVGEFNVALVIKEWRRGVGRPRLVGTVIRDMQITVVPTNNRRPEITIPPDLCVVAGTPIPAQTITATDPDGQAIRLTAFGGIFPPATFVQNQTGPPQASGTFRWTPQCENVRSEPYQVLFRAEDQPAQSSQSLIDEKVMRITVVGPPPQNLQATLQPGSAIAVLNWDRYVCQNASQILIYRREGPSNWTPGPCETGIPADKGYTQIGAVSASTQAFRDDRNGQGLERGKTYCYRIYAVFPLPGGGASIASQETCVTLTGRSALLTNVTVDKTDATTGQITVKWTKPTSSAGFAQPYGYRLLRATGQSTAFTQVYTTGNLNDTVFVNGPINTLTTGYTYRLEFFSSSPTNTELKETAGPASSIFAQGTIGSDGRVALSWTHNVPWNNTLSPTVVFRKDAAGNFVQVATVTGTATGGSYTDPGPFVTGQPACYYVRTTGTYGTGLPTNLVNLSQQVCVQPVPCTPVLSLKATNCDSLSANLFNLPATTGNSQVYTNFLTWTLNTNLPPNCNREIAFYRIFFSPTQGGSYRQIDSVKVLSYAHRNLTTLAGCYQVQAVDASGQASARSNEVCNDNCLLFLLPNIFTPNGDGINDTFRPKVASPIRRTHFTVFNRWGVKIYESSADPLINWNGGGTANEGGRGPAVAEGMYYYQAEVEFADLKSTKKTFKGWVQINR
ncbi:T9SS type B sorting domain-containing protein [Hymenobacter jejuensis]|uniref:T9SS type B sorting domain-containing protein n=1 Tax=Hymenobacter jejuensis TaxID=2502781 RepID=A0A5B7ZWT9_9BACT|nr:gliding motility-associated C-terminal domain-containing protein [Hymenobacter jejuensis]QDA59075.1 T9SS type B sorting domain-containing protein [Hymenobacter jejuensis]